MAKKLLALFVLCLFCLLSTACALALPARVKVNLFSSQKSYSQVYISGPVKVVFPQSKILPKGLIVLDTSGGGICLRSASTRHLLLGPLPRVVLAPAASTIGLHTDKSGVPRQYRGSITFVAPDRNSRDRLIAIINDVDVHSYITSCVGSESLPTFSGEALKAQAVLSTTLLEKHYRGKPLSDSTEEQSYLGCGGERPEVVAAVDKVFGQELVYDGRPVDVYFGSTCGGTTATPAIFGGINDAFARPYLRAVKCSYCKKSPFFVEHREIMDAAVFFKTLFVKNPHVVKENAGRPDLIVCESTNGSKTFSGYQFWLLLGQHFGWGAVPSTRYSIATQKLPSGSAGLLFRSRGCGHGVGLCQWGAEGQAEAGRGYKEILDYYFPGTKLKIPAGQAAG